ncbi:hypothetical protein [Streptomyces rimosus]|uniref:hypothetical protein n=1 Tax=Streptomyces rimosus TaxID=1927 RepID=UPI000B1BD62C|nr:hypothetical protein [Streptomyces rimosus]
MSAGGRFVAGRGTVAGVCVGAWWLVVGADGDFLALGCPFVGGVVLGQGLLRVFLFLPDLVFALDY